MRVQALGEFQLKENKMEFQTFTKEENGKFKHFY